MSEGPPKSRSPESEPNGKEPQPIPIIELTPEEVRYISSETEPSSPESRDEELRRQLADARRTYAELDLRTTDRRAKRMGKVLEKAEEAKQENNQLLAYGNTTPKDAMAELQEIASAENTYRDALNALRTHELGQLTTETEHDPTKRSKEIEEMILAGTVEEADRFYNVKMEVRAEQRLEKRRERFSIARPETPRTLGNLPRFAAEISPNLANQAWNGALRAVEAYRKLPVKTKLAVSAVIFLGGLAGGTLAMPLVAAGAAGLVVGQRFLGGASTAMAAEAGMQKLFSRRHKKEALEKTEFLRPDLETGTDADAELYLNLENQRLNQIMFDLAGKQGREKAWRFGVAGAVFGAIATGLPGKTLRFLIGEAEATETGQKVVGQVKTWKDNLWQSFKDMTGFDSGVRPTTEPSSPKGIAKPLPQENSGTSVHPPVQPSGNTPALKEPPPSKIPTAVKSGIPAPEDTKKTTSAPPLKTRPVAAQVMKPSPESIKITELATVKKGEGAWQAVRRQFYERVRLKPSEFHLTPEQAAKLPSNLDDLGKGTKVGKILDRETLATLKKAGYINPDGTTHLGVARPGVKVILEGNNTIRTDLPEGSKGKATYAFPEHKPATAHIEEIKGSSQAPEPSTARSYRSPSYKSPLMTTPEIETAPRPGGVDTMTAKSAPTGMTSVEYAQSVSPQGFESTNLKAIDLNPTTYRPVADMTGKRFIHELGRHSREINDYRLHRIEAPREILIHRGPFFTGRLRVPLRDAIKHLDLSERLERKINAYPRGERSKLLKKPVQELMRTLSLTKK